MKKNSRFLLLSAVVAALFSSLVYGDEVFIPATQIEKGKCSLAFYYQTYSEKLDFSVSQKNEISVGNLSYLSQSQTDIEGSSSADGLCAQLMFNPNNGLYYWIKAGMIGYELDIPSFNTTNKLSGQEKGAMLGAGVRKQLYPGTIVTPAVAFDVGFSYYTFGFDCLKSGDIAPISVDEKLEILETQADIVISKRIKEFEPYGGLKIYRKTAVLTDKPSFSNVSGFKDDAGLFFGLKFDFYQNEALVVEGSFIGDTSFSAGINIGF